MDIQIKTQPFYAKLAYILVSLIAMVYIAILAKEIISPLIFSFLFSILLLPFATLLERKLKFPRSISSMFSVVVLIAVILLVLYLVGSQATNLASDWPLFKEQVTNSLASLQDWVSNQFHIDKSHQLQYLNDATSKILNSGTVVLGATVLSMSSLMLFLVFTFIYTFFFLLYRRLIMKFLISVFSEEFSETVYDIVEQTQYIIRKYIVGLMIQMAIISIVACIVFCILGIKYAILLGLITGILNIIPYIGIFTALVLSSLITFATAASLTKVLLVVGAVVVIHILDSNVLLPTVVGAKVKINALITVLGVIVGEMIWGISGMFLSIPVIAVAKIIFDRVDSLKPWGLLLGDEEKPKDLLKKVQDE